jgi:hypothetical protein
MSIGINLRLKPIINVVFRRSLDPPKSPLIRGTLRNTLVPPLLRGVRGDLDFDTNKKDYRFDIMRTLVLTTNQVL